VQAGTGTGKSLAYLVPAVRHAVSTGGTVVVATATIALQRQLIDRDLPRLLAAVAPLLDREPTFAILKGRRNYLCLHREKGGTADDPQDALFEPPNAGPPSPLGRQVKRLHEWAEQTSTGDRDDLVPGVPDAAWRQVSVSAQECIGAQRCRFGSRCFAERARNAAARADIVVTNHALLAIDATSDTGVLPEHDVVIIDEAHDLVDRVTAATAGELSAPAVDTAAQRAGRLTESAAMEGTATAVAERLREAAAALAIDLGDAAAGRMDELAGTLAATLTSVHDAAAACADAIRASAAAEDEEEPQRMAAAWMTLASLDEVQRTASRIMDSFGEEIPERAEVVWLDRPFAEDSRRPPTLRVAPLEVGRLLRSRLFGDRTVALTSATLALGGSFTPLAIQWGLPPQGAGPSCAGDEEPLTWRGLDVGSPFDHPRSGILYIARHLPPPGRDQLPEAYLTELAELIDAAGGRTLGLFSSMRAAREAAGALRERISQPLLCQGDDLTAQLVRQFSEDEPTCLFGTLSLWQGVDVPGSSLQLVVIDRIPFPRPDDPLASARQRAVAARGGNGFMTVAASHAALLLAQGAGRLLRTMTDRGVVAVLDPRLMTARYGAFLRASLPPFWATTDPALVRAALGRLAAASDAAPAQVLCRSASWATPYGLVTERAPTRVKRPMLGNILGTTVYHHPFCRGLAHPVAAGGARMRRQPRSGKRHVLRWVAVGAVVIVTAGTLGAYLKYRAIYDSITRVTVPSTALGHRPPVYSTNSLNILVYGDDSRKGLTPHQQYVLRTGHDTGELNTDTIMLVHISPGRHRVTVVSIPRDGMVPVYECDSVPGHAGQQANPGGAVQINSLLQIGGPTCLWKTVEQVTGVRIDHFIGIGMLGFVKVVNDLGGVNVCVPFNVNDQVSGLNLTSGEHHINGIQALAFWRTREAIGDGSDLQRIQRDQFMSAQVVKGVLHSGLLSNPIRLLQVISDAAASMTTDAGMTVSDLVRIGESFRSLSGRNVQFITAPNEPWMQNPNRVQLMQPQAGQVFAAIARDQTVPRVSTTPPASQGARGGAQVLTTSPGNVKVEVLNGSGVARAASDAAAGLTSRGFDVTGTGDAPNFAYTKSVIEYASAADMAAVHTLEKQLTNVTSLHVATLTPGTVDLILGSEFTGLVPQRPQTSQTPQVSATATVQPSQVPSGATPSASASASPTGVAGLAKSNGGITAAAACTSDSSAFTGPLSP
jgi:ATP-dependent DNA helicase DinG